MNLLSGGVGHRDALIVSVGDDSFSTDFLAIIIRTLHNLIIPGGWNGDDNPFSSPKFYLHSWY